MADKRITELQPLPAAGAQGAIDVLAVADVSSGETKKISLADAVAAGLASSGGGSIDGSQIEDRSIAGVKLELGAVTSAELAPNSVYTDRIVDGAVSNEKLAGGITGDKLVDGTIGSTQLEPKSVDGQVHIKDRSINGGQIEMNSLTSNELAQDSVGIAELKDDSVDTENIRNNALATRHYLNASVTNEKLASGIDGNKILNGSISGDKLEPGAISGNQIDSISLDKLPNAGANTVLAGPTSGPTAKPTYRAIVPADLPTATTTNKGAVSVPVDGGLSLNSGGVGISNTVTPNGFPFVNYDKHGSITSGRALTGTDLPPPALGNLGGVKAGDGLATTTDGTIYVTPATDSKIGGVIEGTGITIASNGTISQTETGVVAGTWTKVTVDAMGNVTQGALLATEDIPRIDWSQIDNPVIDSGMLADDAVERRHLADYSVMFIQEAAPTVDSTVHTGCMWFRESTAGLSAWNGNSWMSIGQGRLSAENLRYAGIVDASTGLISGLTQFGVAEGLQIGQAVPTATDELTGIYFIVQTAGDQVTVLPSQNLDAGDWILCNGAAAGWVRIDTMAGGGGGGGVSNLKDLLDVSIAGATTGALLQLQSNGQWADCYGLDGGDY